MDNNLKRTIILEHYQNPKNKGLIDDDSYTSVNMNNESCIDNIDLFIKIKDGVIMDAYFDGEACAITTSATSIMVRRIIGMKLEDAKELMKEYLHMINEEEYNKDLLEDLNAYYDISRQPSRIKCARLPFDTLNKTINIYEVENEK